MIRLNSVAGCSNTGKLKPALAPPLPAPPASELLGSGDEFLASRSPNELGNAVPPSLSFFDDWSMRLSVLLGVAVVSSAFAPTTENDPIGMRHEVAQVGMWLMKLITAVMVSTNVRSGPPAMVLNALAIDTIVTSSPPTRWLRSDSTGIGAYSVLM